MENDNTPEMDARSARSALRIVNQLIIEMANSSPWHRMDEPFPNEALLVFCDEGGIGIAFPEMVDGNRVLIWDIGAFVKKPMCWMTIPALPDWLEDQG